jgi:phosphomannomutase
MLKKEFMFGAEESSGFGFKNHIPERDGILTGLMFCEMIAQSGKSLRDIMQEIKFIVGDLFYDRVDIEYEHLDVKKLFERLIHNNITSINQFSVTSVRTFEDSGDVNGVKFLLGNSRWLMIRASHTEPLVRIYAEGRDNDEVKQLLEEGKRLAGV